MLRSSRYKLSATLGQLELVYLIRKNATRADFSKAISSRMLGMFETFIDSYHGKETNDATPATDTFKVSLRRFVKMD